MVKSETSSSKMHLEVNNDVEFDIRNESTATTATSKRNTKSKKATSTGEKMKVSGFKSTKAFMPSISVNGKRLPAKSNSRKVSVSAHTKKKAMKMQSSRNRNTATKRRSISKKSMKKSRSSMKSMSVSAVGRDSRVSLAVKRSSSAKKRSSSIPKKSMKRSRMTIFRNVRGRFAKKTFKGSMIICRDSRGRFAEKKC